jgi:hypothetical protein
MQAKWLVNRVQASQHNEYVHTGMPGGARGGEEVHQRGSGKKCSD